MMATDPTAWTVDANDALEVTLYGPSASNPVTFSPEFTCPLFGEAEKIYGYQDLSIKLDYAGWDMRGCLRVSWQQKLDDGIAGTQVDDVTEVVKEYLPPGTCAISARFLT
jgi:histone acetyltransferase 1